MTDRPPGGGSGSPSPGSHISVTAPAGPSGTVIVTSDAILSQLDALDRLAENLRLSAGEVLGIVDGFEASASIAYSVPTAEVDARRMTSAAVEALLGAQDRAAALSAGVRTCLTRYAETEQGAMALAHRVNEGAAWLFGAEARVFGLPLALAAASGLLAGWSMTGRLPTQIGPALQDFLKVHGRILTNPLTVAAIRELSSDADGLGEGFMLVPPPLAAALQASGATGVSSSADSVVGVGRAVGLFEHSGVTVTRTSSFEYGAPPTSLRARAESFPIPESDPNGEQIRIDRYVQPGKPDRFDVYIAGTVTFDPVTGTEPFDLSSDLEGVGQQSPESYSAVVQAMHEAGIRADSPIVVNGYSQGGLLASMVAASGNYNVKGVVTFGAPSGQVHIPASIPVLSVRNSEDLVPATSGYDVNPNAVVVTRSVFAHQAVPSDWAVPAHRLSYYQQTAAAVDAATSSPVRAVLDPLDNFGAGAHRVDSTLWLATRVPVTGAGNLPGAGAAGEGAR